MRKLDQKEKWTRDEIKHGSDEQVEAKTKNLNTNQTHDCILFYPSSTEAVHKHGEWSLGTHEPRRVNLHVLGRSHHRQPSWRSLLLFLNPARRAPASTRENGLTLFLQLGPHVPCFRHLLLEGLTLNRSHCLKGDHKNDESFLGGVWNFPSTNDDEWSGEVLYTERRWVDEEIWIRKWKWLPPFLSICVLLFGKL